MAKPIQIIDENTPLVNGRAELDVLYACINDHHKIDKINENLFYDDRNKTIYKAIVGIMSKGQDPNIAAITEHFLRNDNSVPVDYLVSLQETLISTADASFNQNVFILTDLFKRRKAKEIALRLLSTVNDGAVDMDEVLSEFDKNKQLIDSVSTDKYLQVLEVPSPEEIRRALAEEPTGIETKYAFTRRAKKEEQQQIIIPAGAITMICGLTSHGKSRFLQNLALDTAQDKKDGCVLYYTFEEDKKAVFKELLNIYADMDLSDNNLRTISSYYHGTHQYFNDGVSIANFQAKENRFMQLIQSKKLHIIEEDYDSAELCLSLRKIARNRKVKAVFVDYAQLLYKSGNKLSRTEELKGIMKDLLKVAKEFGLPIVMAAQLKRSAASPTSMTNQDIADSADLERIAALVIMLWNSSYKTNDTKAINDMADLGITLGEGGKIYAECTKYRGAERGNYAVLSFKGNRGLIEHNYTPKNKELKLPLEPSTSEPAAEEDAPF